MEVKLNNISFISANKKILDNINIRFHYDEINAIIGRNGSGKTTICKLLNTDLISSSGSIDIDSIKIDKNSVYDPKTIRFNIGVINEFPDNQFFFETIKKEISSVLEYFNYPTDKIDKRVLDSLKMVGLDESYLYRDPLSLSCGESRKLSIAMTLSINPEIIILDNPTIGMDNYDKKNLIKILKTIKRRYNKTIVVITQDIEFIHSFIDYIFVIDNGRLVLEGDKYQIFKQEELLKKYGIKIPEIIRFKLLSDSKAKLFYRDDVNDLIKDILRER